MIAPVDATTIYTVPQYRLTLTAQAPSWVLSPDGSRTVSTPAWPYLWPRLRFAVPQTFDRQELHRISHCDDAGFLEALSRLFVQPCLTVEALVNGRWRDVREAVQPAEQARDLNNMRKSTGGLGRLVCHLAKCELGPCLSYGAIEVELKQAGIKYRRFRDLIYNGGQAIDKRGCRLCAAMELIGSA